MKNYILLMLLASFTGCSLVNVEEGGGKRYAFIYGFNGGSLSYAANDAIGLGKMITQHGYQITLRADTTATFAGDGNSEAMAVYESAIQAQEVNERITRLKSEKVVLVFDHCYSGSHIAQTTNRLVLTASTENELSWEFGVPINHGIFTYYLIKGLSNKNADVNNDKVVSLSELYYYANERVINFTTTNAPSPQYPQFLGNKNLEIILY